MMTTRDWALTTPVGLSIGRGDKSSGIIWSCLTMKLYWRQISWLRSRGKSSEIGSWCLLVKTSDKAFVKVTNQNLNNCDRAYNAKSQFGIGYLMVLGESLKYFTISEEMKT